MNPIGGSEGSVAAAKVVERIPDKKSILRSQAIEYISGGLILRIDLPFSGHRLRFKSTDYDLTSRIIGFRKIRLLAPSGYLNM